MEDTELKRVNIFKLVQRFLKNPPLIVWGSGATTPYGIPSMGELNETLKDKIDGFDILNENLEIELGKEKYVEMMPQIKQAIWEKVNTADIAVLKRIIQNSNNEFIGVKLLIEKIIETHPQVVNIVTTNYDRLLEFILSYNNIPYTDGFNGRTLSIFDENQFQDKGKVNLIKVHGSLNWFDLGSDIRYLPCNSQEETPMIIAPGKNKYQEAYHSPYRELIQKADNLIKAASSFLAIGFGFNDEHLTPKIKAKVKNGTPIVLITRNISEGCYEELKDAEKYMLFEKSENDNTKIIYKNGSEDIKEEELDGDYWQLKKFMEIL